MWSADVGITHFPSMEAIQAFSSDQELTAQTIETGAVIDSGVMTPIEEDYFINYPDAHMKHLLTMNQFWWLDGVSGHVSNSVQNISLCFSQKVRQW